MAKFNIEVELDWLDHDENIDEEIYQQVISGIQDRLTRNIERKMTEELNEKTNEAVAKAVDIFLENITVDRIEEIEIPVKSGGTWSSEVEMIPIAEFIGKRFEKAVNEKKFDDRGRTTNRYDAEYSLIEYLTKDFIAEELNDKVIEMIKQAKTRAEQTLIKSLEENLQQQLNADMLQRLDVPYLLKQMQETILVEGDSNES